MNIQRETISKIYYEFDLTKITNLLRVDDYSAIELKEIYDDSISIVEDYINKNVAYTLNRYTFSDENDNSMCLKHIIIDEGNFYSISGITSKDSSGNVNSITDYSTVYDNNNVKITFGTAINTKELKVVFHTGYPEGKLNKSIRRAIYIIMSDLYDSERSSYSLGNSKKSDVIDRILSPFRKRFFYNYNNNTYLNYF